MSEEDGGYKQTKTIGEYFKKEQGRRNKIQLLIRPKLKTIEKLDHIKFWRDFNGSYQEIIILIIDEYFERMIKERICHEDPTMINLIKQAEEAETIHNYLFDKGYNPDERRQIIKSVKDEKLRDRLEILEEDWFRQHHLSLKRRGRLRGYR